MQSYSELVSVGPGIWIRDGEWYDTVFRRRMTVMALENGELIIHNAFELKDDDLRRLKGIGKVAAIVMPNAFHGDEVGWMAERLPEARVLVPAACAKKAARRHRVDGTLENDWPPEWAASVACLSMQGMRIIQESVFFHRASRSLVLTDLVFNMASADFGGSIERTLMAWNHVGSGFGPSWLCDHVFTRDLSARSQSIEAMLAWDFDRVIMSHGRVVDKGGKALVKQAFPENRFL